LSSSCPPDLKNPPIFSGKPPAGDFLCRGGGRVGRWMMSMVAGIVCQLWRGKREEEGIGGRQGGCSHGQQPPVWRHYQDFKSQEAIVQSGKGLSCGEQRGRGVYNHHHHHHHHHEIILINSSGVFVILRPKICRPKPQ